MGYPAILQLTEKNCLVVGGGTIALRKARALQAAGARVTLVAPRIHASGMWVKNLQWRRKHFSTNDLRPVPWLVIVATDDERLNARVSRLCRQRKIWANVVDRPALCDFILPAVVRRGPVSLAVSTGGSSPALAKFLAARGKKYFGPEVARWASTLGKMRSELLRRPMAERKKILSRLITPAWLNRFRQSGAARAFRAAVKDRLERR